MRLDKTCALCHESFTSTRSDEDAMQEMRQNFPDVPDSEPLDVICDPCYRGIEWICNTCGGTEHGVLAITTHMRERHGVLPPLYGDA